VVEWCNIYKKSRESIDHLLLHCEVARDQWSCILALFGVKRVVLRRVPEWLTN
jgi:hypothetical protein